MLVHHEQTPARPRPPTDADGCAFALCVVVLIVVALWISAHAVHPWNAPPSPPPPAASPATARLAAHAAPWVAERLG